MDKLSQVLDSIEKDTLSGSAALADNLIESLLKLESNLTSADKLILIEKLEQLALRKPFFAVLQHLGATLKNSKENWPTLLKVYRERFAQIHQKISKQLVSIIGESPKVFLLHSNSKTIVSVFENLPKKNVIRIYQTWSHPENEGVIQAEILKRSGFNVMMVEDEPPQAIIDQIDFFITGADLILPEYFVNKSGTLRIAEKIREMNKSYLILADERKFSTVQIQILPSSFEQIPRNLVSKLLTGENQSA